MSNAPQPKFVFVSCQNGAETACKKELAAHHPDLRLAYSRPGFLTFKVASPETPGDKEETLPGTNWSDHPVLVSTFARTFGIGIGRIQGDDLQTQLKNLLELTSALDFDHIHVWQRDEGLPGDRGFEPFPSVLAETVGEQILAQFALARNCAFELNSIARAGQKVLDIVLLEPSEWYVGHHTADSVPQRWPGGVPQIDASEELVSRAYLKLAEALEWCRLTIHPGDVCVEIGSAPGGAAQLLVEKGAQVIAVDPADLDPALQNHPQIRHLKKRGKHVRKSEFANARWLLVDVNVAPNYTLDSVEEIVKSPKTNIRGLILTMKLTNWDLADHVDGYRQRVRNWGFKLVRTRQLAFNRHEFCLVALRNRFDARAKRNLEK